LLIYIGGAARTGKGILARRLLHEYRMSFLSLDVLKMGLTRGVPEYDIDPNSGPLVVSERLWPLVREMSLNLLGEGVDYVVEGEVLPKHVAAFQREHTGQVKACFLGYASITPEQKLRHIRAHAGLPNDWSGEYEDAELLNVIREMIVFSQYLKDECAVHNLRYFNTSQDFEQTLDAVVEYLVV
jgi:hypothetical protein